MRTCPICGTKFKEYRSSNEKVYCSRECQMRGVKIRQAAKRKAVRHAARTMAKCAVCGKEFLRHRPDMKYCCKACGNKAGHRMERERQIAAGLRTTVRGRPRGSKSSVKVSALANAVTHHIEILERAMAEKARAYLSLPASERWARRGELSKKELAMARKMHAADTARF